MNTQPWVDWIPGVLCKNQVQLLAERGYLTGVEDPENDIDYSSVDLHVGGEQGYELTSGSVKPSGKQFLHFLTQHGLAELKQASGDGTYLLRKGRTYLFKLRERLEGLEDTEIYGQATAKSSIGRLDVLVRLIVDGMTTYESFKPDHIATGDMFVEVTPLAFPVRLKPGDPLTQLRLFYGKQSATVYDRETTAGSIVHSASGHNDGTLSADLSDAQVFGQRVAAFCARDDEDLEPVDLSPDSPSKAEPWRYWRFLRADKHQRLKIEKGKFYIIRSQELLCVPKGIAVYCRAIDETIGEMRIHYAGFAHPFFGAKRGDGKAGTPLIFEVTGHDLDVSLKNGEKMAALTFYRMSQDAPESDLEEPTTSPQRTYNEQDLQLSKRFQDWPAQTKNAGGRGG